MARSVGRSTVAVAALAATSAMTACAKPVSEPCGDGAYCPVHTTCGEPGICLAELGQCNRFLDRTPCVEPELGRGHCLAGECLRGIEILGFVVSPPSNLGLPDVTVTVREHPDVLPILTNVNGYFGPRVPRDSEVIIEMTYEGAIPTITRTVSARDREVHLDVLYGGIPILFPALVDTLVQQAGTSIAPGKGMLTGEAFDASTPSSRLGDVSVSVADNRCEGPYYFDKMGMPLLGATGTDAGAGVYAFINCEPGPITVTATHARGPCRALDASTPGPITGTVEPNTLTSFGRLGCEPP